MSRLICAKEVESFCVSGPISEEICCRNDTKGKALLPKPAAPKPKRHSFSAASRENEDDRNRNDHVVNKGQFLISSESSERHDDKY